MFPLKEPQGYQEANLRAIRLAELETPNQYGPGWDLIAAAALVARTPDAPLPEAG